MLSHAVQYEVALNETLCLAEDRGGATVPAPSVIAKCCSILDEMEQGGAFGAYNTVVSQVKKLVRRPRHPNSPLRYSASDWCRTSQLYRAIFSNDQVTTDASGQLQKVAYATLLAAQQTDMSQLQEDLTDREEQLKQCVDSLAASRSKALQLAEQLSREQQQVQAAGAKYVELEERCTALQQGAAEQQEKHRHMMASMNSDLVKEKNLVAAARHEAEHLRHYVDNHEANRKAFLDMQMYRRSAGKREEDEPDDLHDALTLENQIVLLLNMRIEEFEESILGVTEETTDRLRARFVQEMAVMHEELSSIRRHIAQLGREGVVADVASPMKSLIAGSGAVFRVEEEVSVSRDQGRTFAPLSLSPSDSTPQLQDQFLRHSTFAVTQDATAAPGSVITHVQVKLVRRHDALANESKIPLSELPAPLGTGQLWDLYRRKNGHVNPKRPKLVTLPQLLRTIDEVYRCKYILEDDRGSSQVPAMDILDDFFFDHMQMTYGEEWISLHVVHGIFGAIEKYRETIPTVEMFYQCLNARMDDSGWRYIRLCREVAERHFGGAGIRTIEAFRRYITQLYSDTMTEDEQQTTEREFVDFAANYGSKDVPQPGFDEETVFEFLTKKILDGKEHCFMKSRKKLIAFDVLQRNCLKQVEFMQFISGYLPKVSTAKATYRGGLDTSPARLQVRKSLPIMLFRGASAMLRGIEQKVELTSLARKCDLPCVSSLSGDSSPSGDLIVRDCSGDGVR